MRLMNIVAVQILLQLQLILIWHAVCGRILQWLPNTDFDNAQNWKTGRLPCRNEHVRFPPSVASVIVQRNNTVLEIILPNDGEIILGDGVELSFPSLSSGSTAGDTCPEQVNEYNGTTAKSWFDPLNWCEVADFDNVECQTDEARKYLHTESVPCSGDEVVFHSESRIVVDIGSSAEIKVQSLRIGDQTYNKQSLRQYLNTDAGRQHFVRASAGGSKNSSINILGSQSSCTDPTGCLCKNTQLEDKICAFERLRCPHTRCDSSLHPKGHCCPICGAILTLDFNSKFRPAVMSNLVKSKSSIITNQDTKNSDVWWTVSKSESEEGHEIVQLVIADNDDGLVAINVAKVVESVLLDDKKTKGRYGVTDVEMTISVTKGLDPHRHTGEQEAGRVGTAGIVAAIICAILLIILIAFTVWCVVLRKQGKRVPLPYIETIARWRTQRGSSSGRGDMELGRRGVVFDNRVVYEGTTSFENVGISNILAAQQFDPLEVQPTENVQRGGFDNPLYANDPGIREVISQSKPPSGFAATKVATADEPYENVEQVKSFSGDQKKGQQQQQQTAVTSKVAGVFRGMRSDVPPRRFENEDDDDEQDDNANVWRTGPESIGYDQQPAGKKEEAAPPKDSAKKKKQGKKAKKSGGTRKENTDGRHQRLEDSTDGESGEETAKSGKGPGFDNPCYDESQGFSSKQPQAPSSEAKTRRQMEYKTGFENPAFDDKSRSTLKLDGAEADQSKA